MFKPTYFFLLSCYEVGEKNLNFQVTSLSAEVIKHPASEILSFFFFYKKRKEKKAGVKSVPEL